MTFLTPVSTVGNVASRRKQPTPAITAELSGANRCEAQGIVATGTAPALILCRQLLQAGVNPDKSLDVYRQGTLALRIRRIGEGAKLAVKDDNRGVPRFRPYREGPDGRGRAACGEAPPMRAGAENEERYLEAAE
jgi:hypothetical protein